MAYGLITGASGGIGLCLARELAQRKIDLLLVSRSAEKLSKICDELKREFNIQAEYLSLDLSEPNAVNSLMNWLKEKSYPVNILINNAGYGILGNGRIYVSRKAQQYDATQYECSCKP
jgi:uncharacterized protein